MNYGFTDKMLGCSAKYITNFYFFPFCILFLTFSSVLERMKTSSVLPPWYLVQASTVTRDMSLPGSPAWIKGFNIKPEWGPWWDR